MPRKTIAFLGILIAAAVFSLPAEEEKPQETTLTIRGMTCGGCTAKVEKRLEKIEGVVSYEVSLKEGEARVTFQPGKTDAEKIAKAVSETGFRVEVKKKKESEA